MSAPVVLIRIKKLFVFLEERNATSPETAVPLAEIPFSGKWYVRRLFDQGVLRQVGDRMYLEAEKRKEYLKGIRLRALGLLVFVLILFLCTFLLRLF